MSNELQSLSSLFQSRLFRIPDYQRGYAWQQAQLMDFWDDLLNLHDGKFHYTGQISLKILKNTETIEWGTDLWLMEKGFKPCHIVDGQQRLTTFVILLNELIEFTRLLAENSNKTDDLIMLGCDTLQEIKMKYISICRPPNLHITTYLFGYEVDNPSAEYLKYRIFNESNSADICETYYTKNLKFAKSFFCKNISELYNLESTEGINKLYLKLTQRLMFNIYEIADDYDVFIAFETMNNRGKKLTNLELLKNRLIYLTTLYSDEFFDELDKSELRKRINEAWKEVYYQLGRNEKHPLSDDEFLRAHWICYYTYSRKKGNDYIDFLLKKFSSKNIFDKQAIITKDTIEDISLESNYDIEDATEEQVDFEALTKFKLESSEIEAYVDSLKSTAKEWYYTYFPNQSDHLSKSEILYVDKLNRIGIGYFRPLVMAIISRRDASSEQRTKVFMAIERFIFICFRLGYFNATFKSSEYYRIARNIYTKKMDLEELITDLNKITDINIEFALPNFVTRIDKLFNDKQGFYNWNAIKYFLFEYELHLAQKNNLDKLSWEHFTKSEKDKVSIEHILPQTPTKYYWENQFRQFNEDEVGLLSCALGNLLALSQSKNSALQNDSFTDKKTSTSNGREGYRSGSNSEIEVSIETDWTAEKIYNRSKSLLLFMAERWGFTFTEEQLERLIYVNFAIEEREISEPLSEIPDKLHNDNENIIPLSKEDNEINNQRLTFWTSFIDFCKSKGRGHDIAIKKPHIKYWYDVDVSSKDFHLSFTLTRGNCITLLIYVYNDDAFRNLENNKESIEMLFGDSLDWYSSKRNSVAKRIVYRKDADIFNQKIQNEVFSWMIEKFDKLYNALDASNVISYEKTRGNKFGPLKQYIIATKEERIILSFAEIEEIIGVKLCRSAYQYESYWKLSPTHMIPIAIEAAGYKIEFIDLKEKYIVIAKKI